MGAEPDNLYMVQSPLQGSAAVINPDHLSRKSSEGMRWIARSAIDGREPVGETTVVEDVRAKPTERGSEKELGGEEVEVMQAIGKEPVSLTSLMPMGQEPVSSVRTSRSSSPSPLPPAPSLIDRKFWITVGFVVGGVGIIVLVLLVVLAAYSRSSGPARTPSNSTPTATPTGSSDGDSDNPGPKSPDDPGCVSLFSFSHCADSDMFG